MLVPHFHKYVNIFGKCICKRYVQKVELGKKYSWNLTNYLRMFSKLINLTVKIILHVYTSMLIIILFMGHDILQIYLPQF